jgi:hypothetical protein
MIETVRISETSVNFDYTALHSRNSKLHTRRRENLKSNKMGKGQVCKTADTFGCGVEPPWDGTVPVCGEENGGQAQWWRNHCEGKAMDSDSPGYIHIGQEARRGQSPWSSNRMGGGGQVPGSKHAEKRPWC